MSRQLEVVPLASLVQSGLMAVRRTVSNVEGILASLRCIEAIRLYAATHDNRLPEQLSHITEVPIPVNPTTGKPFGYRLQGHTAILDVAGVNYDKQYRIKLAE